MPDGLPSADKLMEKDKSFFSIDTNVIQALGYKFDSGALGALHLQRPIWMSLYLSEVVEKEVKTHRMEQFIEHANQFPNSFDKIQRASGIDFSSVVDAYTKIDVRKTSEKIFDKQLRQFIKKIGGKVLKTEGVDLGKDLFDLYFNGRPPFENRKDKKSEFPDAAALLVLENFAKENNVYGVLISGDSGWSDFASKSEHLYCVKTLDEFTAMFASDGDNAKYITSKVISSLNEKTSSLSKEFFDDISKYVDQSQWLVDEIYCSGCDRVEGEVIDAKLQEDTVEFVGFKVWLLGHDPSMCVVEISISAMVDLNISVAAFAIDSRDNYEFKIGDYDYPYEVEFETDLFVTFHGNILSDEFLDLEFDFVMGGGVYWVDVGSVDIDFSRQD